MADPLSATEDAILARVTATLGATVRAVETLPGNWTLDMLNRALQHAPGVYVALLGLKRGTVENHYHGRIMVYLVSKGATEVARRRGTQRVIGAYDMLKLLLPALEGLDIEDVGRLEAVGADNLFRDAMFDLGGTVYGISLHLPNIPLEALPDEGDLDDFLRVRGSVEVDPDAPAAALHIDLPGPETEPEPDPEPEP